MFEFRLNVKVKEPNKCANAQLKYNYNSKNIYKNIKKRFLFQINTITIRTSFGDPN